MFDQLWDTALLLLAPVGFVLDPSKRVFWLYLLSSGLIAVAVLFWRGMALREIITCGLSPSLWLSRSSLVDLQWIALNHLLRVLLVVPLLGGQIALALLINRALYSQFGDGDFLHWQGAWVSLLFSVCLFLTEDFSRFYLHYLYHKHPLLWRFHAIHHSAVTMTPLTLYRIHSLEMFLNSCRSLLVIGGLSGVFIYCFAGAIERVDVLGASLFVFLFNVAGSNLRHSSLWLGFGRLERFFVSPAQHQIHHSSAAPHIDKNFGATLAIWDRLFCSWLPSRGQRVLAFGLSSGETPQHLRGQLLGL